MLRGNNSSKTFTVSTDRCLFNIKKSAETSALVADTFDGKTHIEWDPQAQITALGQRPFLSNI